MNEVRVIGKCSICGSFVVVPSIWLGVNPPTPTCQGCGATKDDDLPEVKMRPSKTTSSGSLRVRLQ